MPKADFSKKKLLSLYDVNSLTHREIDKIAKEEGNVKLGLALHSLKNELTNKNLNKQSSKKEPEQAKPKISVKVRPKKETGSTQKTIQIRPEYQQAFKKKMTKQEVQDKYFKRTLDPLRDQLNVLVEQANYMYIEQRQLGINSRAAMEAERTLNKKGKQHFQETFMPFNSDLHSQREIKRELSRVMNFLSDYTATTEGGVVEAKQATGLFGGQWRKKGMAGYDEENVTEEDADMVFDIYHRLLEYQGGWQRLIGYFKAVNPGIIDYGSDQLINAIYEMVQNKDSIYVPEDMDVEGAILARANDIVNNMIDSYMKISVLQRSGTDYGAIENPEDAKRRKDIYEWGLKREKYKEDIRNGRNIYG